VVATLRGRTFRRVLEPTCGTGGFLAAAADLGPVEAIGVEVNPAYAAAARSHGTVVTGDVFALDLGRDLPWTDSGGDLLVLGNPPWVTNSALTVLSSANRPERRNIRGLRGIDARTGASNFDIAEAIVLKAITELRDQRPTIAFLCKTSVARSVLSYCAQAGVGVRGASLRRIDALRWFGASVEAALFTLDVTPERPDYSCAVYASLDATSPERTFGIVGGRMVADVDAYRSVAAADGVSPVQWRQGIKHDAGAVMELVEAGGPRQKSGAAVAIEPDYLFPLLKSTDVFHGRTARLARWMVVPQRSLGDDTGVIAHRAPLLHRYLSAHSDVLDGRRSAIYRGRPRYCIFGVGDYSFHPYKVAISGLHKVPEFRVVGPIEGRPVVFDDTCYFASFADAAEAAVVAGLLRTDEARALLASLVFPDAKRPVTKAVLQRVDLVALAGIADPADVRARSAAQAGLLGVEFGDDAYARVLARITN
jgi:hypothetical protein